MWYSAPMKIPSLHLSSQFRGLYARVARKCKVDPSYVSLVANGKRHSEKVETWLRREMKTLLVSEKPRRKTK
jgi:hypothetical protein